MEPNNSFSTPSSFPTPPPVLSAKLLGPVELLKSAWHLFTNNWKLLGAIAVLPSFVIYAFNSLLLTNVGILSFVSVLGVIMGVILSIAMQGAVANSVHRLSTESGVKLTVNDQYKFGFKYFWPLVSIALLQICISFGSSVLFFIPGLIVGIYVALYLFALIIDNKRGYSAFTESFSLVKGRWWGVFGRILFLGLIMLIVSIIMGGLIAVVNIIFQIGRDTLSGYFVNSLLSLILGAIFGPLSLAYIYKLYVSLKETRLANVSTVIFKRWLIAFTVIGPIAIVVIFGILASVVLVSLSSARLKGLEAQRQALMMQQNISNEYNNLLGPIDDNSITPTNQSR